MMNLIDTPASELLDEAARARQLLLARLEKLDNSLAALENGRSQERLPLLLESAFLLLDLERGEEAWHRAREAFDLAVVAEAWEEAVQACEAMSRTDHPEAVKALAHGVWLGVTYPIDPEVSVAILERLVEETPGHTDAAAVTAAAARYVVDLRAEGPKRETLIFFTDQMLGDVARHHQVESPELFAFWVERLALNDAASVLSRLARLLDALVPAGWWIDRDALRARLPEA